MTLEVLQNLCNDVKEKVFSLMEGSPSLSEKDKTAGCIALIVGTYYFFPYTTLASVAIGWYADKKIENLEEGFINFWNSSPTAKAFLVGTALIAVYSRNRFIPIIIGLHVGKFFSPIVEKAQVLYEKVTIPLSPQKSPSKVIY